MALVATAFIAMQTYMKRGVQGRLRDLANQISPKQYEPEGTTSTTPTIITRNGESHDEEKLGTYTTKGFDTTRTDFDSKTVQE